MKEELGYDLHHDNTVHSYSSLLPRSDPPIRGMKNPLAVSRVTQALSAQVYAHASAGRCVLTLGGDHSIAIGTVSGVAKAVRERLGREVALIWVDAHADINTPETSGSGNVHGMPVAFLTRLARGSLHPPATHEADSASDSDVEGKGGNAKGGKINGVNGVNGHREESQAVAGTTNGSSEDKDEAEVPFAWIEDSMTVSLSKLVYIGLRDVDRGEKLLLRKHGIRAFSMHDIDRHGIGRVMELALGHIGSDTPIHLSFDVDALDPMWAPSTGTPVRGGLTLREGDYICESVHETGCLVGVDLVEVNPTVEPGVGDVGAHETVRAGCSLVRCALGESLL